MKKLFLALMLAGCATVSPETEIRQYRADGRPMPLPSEMPAGRVKCEQLCQSYHRHIKQYEANGDCDCLPITYGNEPTP